MSLITIKLSSIINEPIVTKLSFSLANKFNLNINNVKNFINLHLKNKTRNEKRKKSAYYFFSKQNRKTIKEEYIGISFGDISKKLGTIWRELSFYEKEKWIQKATNWNDGILCLPNNDTEKNAVKIYPTTNELISLNCGSVSDNFKNTIKNGHLIVLKDFLSHFDKDYPFDWNNGYLIACEEGYLDIIQLLIEIDGSFDWNIGLEIACVEGYLDIVQLMINKGVRVFDKAFLYACREGHLAIVDLLIQHDIDNSILQDGLDIAIVMGYIDIIPLLGNVLDIRTRDDIVKDMTSIIKDVPSLKPSRFAVARGALR